MTLSTRLKKLESAHGAARDGVLVVAPRPEETGSLALKRALEENGLKSESDAGLIVVIQRFGKGFRSARPAD